MRHESRYFRIGNLFLDN